MAFLTLPTSRVTLLVLVLAVLAVVPLLANAEEEGAAPEPPAVEGVEEQPAEQGEDVVLPPIRTPSLGLDSLLRPRGLKGVAGDVAPKRTSLRGGKDREGWERDFANARSEEHALKEQVDDLQNQIRETAQGDWNYTPTGGAAPTDPEVLRLRAQLKRDKRSLEAATTRLRDLEVEASLANVPDQWIEPTP